MIAAHRSTTTEGLVKLFAGLKRFRSGLWIHDLTRMSDRKEDPTHG